MDKRSEYEEMNNSENVEEESDQAIPNRDRLFSVTIDDSIG